MKFKYLSSRSIVGVIFIVLPLISNVFAGDLSIAKRQINLSTTNTNNDYITVRIPKNSKYLIAADGNGQTLLFQGVSKGKIEDAKACAICTVELSNKFGSFCEKLRDNKKLRKKVLSKTIGREYKNLSFCAGANKVEFLGIQRNDVILTRMNPVCFLKEEVFGRVVYAYPPGCAGKLN